MKCMIFSPNFQPSNSKEGDGSTQPALSVGRISVISSRRGKGSPLLARSPLPTFPRGWLPCSASKFCRGKRSHTRLACAPSSRPSHMLMYSLPPCRSFAKAHSLQSSSTRLCPAMRAEWSSRPGCFLLWPLFATDPMLPFLRRHEGKLDGDTYAATSYSFIER